MGNFLPYGYEKDKEDKHKIVIDRVVETIVQKIFVLYVLNTTRVSGEAGTL
ncbi:hypothetical protein [Clostridium baratii]|uniref:hypothetical protein n=1 Tax=Clostridium baratii TaxID=1561 RepID=UPI003D34C919